MRTELLVGLLVVAGVVAACRVGSDPAPTPTIAVTATTEAPTSTPSPTPTPDPLARTPETGPEALAWAEAAVKAAGPGKCPVLPPSAPSATCVTGDATGGGIPDVALLVPVKSRGATSPHPAQVFIASPGAAKLATFADDLTADASPLGAGFFTFADRTGDGRADLSYVQNICGATGCSARPVVLSWDGTAWRDRGPGDSVANADRIAWEGEVAKSELTVHGGKLPDTAPPESGPTRASTTTYRLISGRFGVSEVVKDPPEYLYHAVEDADDAFAEDMGSSRAAYTKVIESGALKDWKLKPGDPDRRPSLMGYALFRLAIIDAATGRDPDAALDRVIRDSKEPLFVYLAESFRNGYQSRGGVVGGCAEANLYLRTPQGSGTDPGGYVAQLFNYGYANPPGSKWIAKLCPF